MSTGVDKILQQMGGSPEKNKTGVDKILEILENGGGGGGGLPEYTSADIGKVMTVVEGEAAEQTVIPEQEVTLVQDGYVYAYIFGDDDGVNGAFFNNVSVGDKCSISINDEAPVECTAADVFGYALFNIGDLYVGSSAGFGGTGVFAMGDPSAPVKISATAVAPTASVGYDRTPFVVTIDSSSNPKTIDKTYAEIYAAYKSLKPIFAHTIESTVNLYTTLQWVGNDSSFNGYVMNILSSSGTTYLELYRVKVTENEFTYTPTYRVELTPIT